MYTHFKLWIALAWTLIIFFKVFLKILQGEDMFNLQNVFLSANKNTW